MESLKKTAHCTILQGKPYYQKYPNVAYIYGKNLNDLLGDGVVKLGNSDLWRKGG